MIYCFYSVNIVCVFFYFVKKNLYKFRIVNVKSSGKRQRNFVSYILRNANKKNYMSRKLSQVYLNILRKSLKL